MPSLEQNYGMDNQDVIYAGIDDSWWSHVLESHHPKIYSEALNSGSIYFNPKSKSLEKFFVIGVMRSHTIVLNLKPSRPFFALKLFLNPTC